MITGAHGIDAAFQRGARISPGRNIAPSTDRALGNRSGSLGTDGNELQKQWTRKVVGDHDKALVGCTGYLQRVRAAVRVERNNARVAKGCADADAKLSGTLRR